MRKIDKFDDLIKSKLKYYVYVYRDPDTKKPFYVGKGKGNRVFAHLYDEHDEKNKVKKIKELKSKKKEPVIEILAFGLDEKTAFKVEAAAIDLIGIKNLTNEQKGHGARKYGIKTIKELISTNCDEISLKDIKEQGIIINVAHGFSYDMNGFALYEKTRSRWKINKNKLNKIKYVFSVHDGIIVEVYEVSAWVAGCKSMVSYQYTNERPPEKENNRYEFVGCIAPDKIRNKYKYKTISDYRSYGNPIKYLNV